MEGQTKSKKFAVLIAGPVPDELQVKYGNFGDMFVKLLRQSTNEIWEYFFCMDGQIPSDEELNQFDALVITGSKHDAHGDYPWLNKLKEKLYEAYKRKQKILGICFGHQLMSNVIGGRSGRAPSGWDLGSVEVTLKDEFKQTWFANKLNQEKENFNITAVHQDQVLELPSEATVLAFSKTTPFEMYSVGDHILCIQGHPEFGIDFTTDLINSKKGEVFPLKQCDAALLSMKNTPPSQTYLQKLCQAFVHGDLLQN